jgi:hypothetical protein
VRFRSIIFSIVSACVFFSSGCSSDSEPPEPCKSYVDCPQNWWCDTESGECKCTPRNCAGKCCGDDGCGGTCPDYCPQAHPCQPDTCECTDPEDECENDLDCPEGEVCYSSCWVAHNCYDDYYTLCFMKCMQPLNVCFVDFECGGGTYCGLGMVGRCGECVPCGIDTKCGPLCENCAVYPVNKGCVWSPADGGDCGCRDDRDCLVGQQCVDGRCWLDGQEADCGDGIDEDEDGLTDCIDVDDCELQPCDEFSRCESGSCIACQDYCTEHSDCTGCGWNPYCNEEESCCSWKYNGPCRN